MYNHILVEVLVTGETQQFAWRYMYTQRRHECRDKNERKTRSQWNREQGVGKADEVGGELRRTRCAVAGSPSRLMEEN